MYFSCTIDRGLYEVARPKIKRFSFFFFSVYEVAVYFYFFLFFFGLFDVCVKQCCPTINRNFILLSCPNKAASQLLLFVLVFICFSFLFLFFFISFLSLLWTWEERGGVQGVKGGGLGLGCPPAAVGVGEAVSFHGCIPVEGCTSPQHGLCMILHALAALGKR